MSQGPQFTQPASVNGRTVRLMSQAGVVKDVNESAMNALVGQGWYKVADGVGTTAQRPTTGLFRGFKYVDTTLSKLVVWIGDDGGIVHHANAGKGAWAEPVAGALV